MDDPLDAAVLRQLREDVPADVLRAVAQSFETDLGRLAQELLAAARVGDAGAYQRAAHAIAGAAGSVGAKRLEREARAAMNPAHPEPPHLLVPRLIAEAQSAIAALRLAVG